MKNLKKALCLLLCLCLTGALAACGNEPAVTQPPATQTPDPAMEALLTSAAAIVDHLHKGETAEVYALFDDTMKAAITEEQLRAGWEQSAAAAGSYVGRSFVEGEDRGKGYYAVTVREEFSVRDLSTVVVYTPEGAVCGLNISFTAKQTQAEETELWQELPLTVTADERYPLPALLTLPKGVEKPPVVVLVHGSGAGNMNSAVGAVEPFADLAHGLAELGIASLRYDKRAYVYPEAYASVAAYTAEFETTEDAGAAIALMLADERVDADRVFVLGHSLGGMLTPKLAAENPQLAGAIVMAGTLRELWEVLYDQQQEAYAALGELPEEQQAAVEAQLAQIEADYAALTSGDYSDLADDASLLGLPVGYIRSLSAAGGRNYLGELSLPLLILQGSEDFQVYADRDFPLWREALADYEGASFRLYEGLNHLMMESHGLRGIEDYNFENRVAQEVIDDIAEFIKAN